MEQQKNEFPAVLELFGHTRMAGQVSDYQFGGCSFVRVDVPQIGEIPSFTRMLHPNAIYAINPVTEEIMLAIAKSCQARPVNPYDISELVKSRVNALTEGKLSEAETEVHENDDPMFDT